MEYKNVRVRFAPSPTGGLHLGGVRTALFNYLFAKKHNGKFIVRIEDTDQTRLVEGAEKYLLECLEWCGLTPDESTIHPGNYGPYRQSERKQIYQQYAQQLVNEGKAYIAFDTPEELAEMREKYKSAENPSPQYNAEVRMQMRNSISLNDAEVKQLLANEVPHVVRIKMPENEEVRFTDMIRGELAFSTSLIDDKVLLKADGMPTYHLAVVVDDFMMEISHAFRGEEWLPSAPIHLLLWKYLFGLEKMPQWAHLPLILKPDGNGKLSKRDGERLGFPVFAMNWTDPLTNHTMDGFKERGFLPEAFVNMLAMLGWNDGTDRELFSIDELIDAFSIERIHKSGAKFDYEKAKWFNHQWILKLPTDSYLNEIKSIFRKKGLAVHDDEKLLRVADLVKDRCTSLHDFYDQSFFFFKTPTNIDTDSIKEKWTEHKRIFFETFLDQLDAETWEGAAIEALFKKIAADQNIKVGELMLPLRIMLVGSKFGPGVFVIAELLGSEETIKRIRTTLQLLEVI